MELSFKNIFIVAPLKKAFRLVALERLLKKIHTGEWALDKIKTPLRAKMQKAFFWH
jgi:hypothetical protein